MTVALPAFAGYGIELEYMIVDRETLAVAPIADELLRKLTSTFVSEARNSQLEWSNELVLHLLELKNIDPQPRHFLPVCRVSGRNPADRRGARIGERTAHADWHAPLDESPHRDPPLAARAGVNLSGLRPYLRLQKAQLGQPAKHALNMPFANDN